MANNHLLFNALFKRNASADDNRQFLAAVAKEYPYFSAAQFYLLQHTDKKSAEYNIEAAKTAIHFNNPLWLNFQVNHIEVVPPQEEKTFAVETEDNNKVEAADALSAKAEIVVEKVFDVDKMIVVEAEIAAPALHLIEEEEKKATEGLVVTEKQTAITTTPDSIFTSTYPEDNYPEDYPEEEEGNDLEIEPMNIRLDFTNASNTTEDTLLFEPLHTSDYFASLGIKFTGEIKPGDKFGTQLKSFTSWLKTMKKIHVSELPEPTDHSHISIQQMAEQSNQDAEVLTEAMAEVLLQQGKTVKAIEVFEKLSLHNPAKKAYFAAKIDQINR